MKTSIRNNRIFLFAILAASAYLFTVGCSNSETHSHDQSAQHDNSPSGHTHGETDDNAGEKDDQEKKDAGPNGGRIITSADPHIEFLVTEERHIQLTILDSDSQGIAHGNQIISLIGGDRSSPTQIAFSPKGNVLLSDKPLPVATDVPVVLQIQTSPTAEIVLEKFNVNLGECSSCEYQEYACVCGHDN